MAVGEVSLDWLRLLEASLLRASISHERERPEEIVGTQVTRSPTGTVQSVLCTGSAIGPHAGISRPEYLDADPT